MREIVEQHITFIVHSRNSNFWFDNWLGSGPLALRLGSVSDHKVSDFFIDGGWNFRLMGLWVPPSIINEIRLLSLPQFEYGVEDLMIWAPSQSGVVTLSSAFNLVRPHMQRSFMFTKIWHPRLPLKVSIFLLCLLRNRLPLDLTIRKLGISGPSKCFCCVQANVECLDHVFCSGQVAVFVWNFFGSASGVLNLGGSVRAYIAGWWYSARRNGFLAFVHFIIPSLICWNIWKSRNLARF